MNPPEEDTDSINSKDSLSQEATFINHALSQQLLDKKKPPVKFEQPNIFGENDDNVAQKGYLYRRWNLSDGMVLICRCEIDGYTIGVRKQTEYLTINALSFFFF